MFLTLALQLLRQRFPPEIHDVQRLRDVQLPWFSVLPEPMIVIHPVGEVRALLDLHDHRTRADGMHRAGLDQKDIAAMDFHLLEILLHRVVLE